MPLKCGYKDKTFNAFEFNYERVQTDISKASCFRQRVAKVALHVDKMIWRINKNMKSLQSVIFFSFLLLGGEVIRVLILPSSRAEIEYCKCIWNADAAVCQIRCIIR